MSIECAPTTSIVSRDDFHERRHAVSLSTLRYVTNKLKEFIIHALLLARIEHGHIFIDGMFFLLFGVRLIVEFD